LAAPSDEGSRAARGALSAASLEAVLCLLDADRERAGVRYEAIRRKLARFFECRGCSHGDELADETIDRVGRRLAEGEHVRHADAGAYFHGVARNVLRESWRTRRPCAPAPARPAAVEADEALGERRLRCLDACLATLSPEERQLILWYYQAGERHVEARRGLAGALGIRMNALRIRAHRIRARLEACVRARLAAEIEWVPEARLGEDTEDHADR
jgi:DNA-directed RNA polymerase specialized sigma24 family protein